MEAFPPAPEPTDLELAEQLATALDNLDEGLPADDRRRGWSVSRAMPHRTQSASRQLRSTSLGLCQATPSSVRNE